MPEGKIARILSFSSEDPKYPASNLLKSGSGGGGRWKWKCKDQGEPSAWLILQLEQVARIVGLNLGNEGSAFVEIHVGRSTGGGPGSAEPEFKVLVSSTSLMTPKESREETNCSRVRNLGSESFDKEVGAQKWDVLKVFCSQPFNRHIQYGLSFLEVRVADENPEHQNGLGNAVKKIGSFSLRTVPITGQLDMDDDPDPVRIGAFFAKRQAQAAVVGTDPQAHSFSSTQSPQLDRQSRPSPKTPTIAAQIRQISLESPAQTSSKSNQAFNSRKFNQSQKKDDSPSPSPRSTEALSSSSASSSPKPISISDPKIKKRKQMKDSNCSDSDSDPSPQPPKVRRKFKTAPFSRLFSNVTFVMSGYQNPRRSEIRRKALEMGGKCLPDWNPRCTHLVCAFINTPKFHAVRGAGNGKIVKEKWIEESYDAKTRFPWRRYCLDRNDEGSESEEEIFAEDQEQQNQVQDPTNQKGKAQVKNSKSEERKRKRSPHHHHQQHQRLRVISSSSSEEEEDQNHGTEPPGLSKECQSPKTEVDEDIEAYEADTDVEDDSRMDNENEHSFFRSLVFYFHNLDHDSEIQQKITQTIHEYKGLVQSRLDENVSIVLTPHTQTNWTEDLSELMYENPNLLILNQDWIFECEKEQRKVPMGPYIIQH